MIRTKKGKKKSTCNRKKIKWEEKGRKRGKVKWLVPHKLRKGTSQVNITNCLAVQNTCRLLLNNSVRTSTPFQAREFFFHRKKKNSY